MGGMNEHAGDLAGKTQEEADQGDSSRGLKERGPAQEAGALPALGRHVRALPHADRAARLAAVVGRDGRTRANPRSRRCASGSVRFHPGVAASVRDPLARGGSRTGTSPASSGGAISSRSGTCPDGHVTCALAAARRVRRMRLDRAGWRDPDVLDTWFSSALWPYAKSAGREQTAELERYYPGNVNSTAREIIRLWENRMIWTGLELLGDIPFTDVIIHSTILASDGRRMSKSLGTGVDPLEPDRQARRRRDSLRAAEDDLHPGRPLHRRGRLEEGRKLDDAVERVAACCCRWGSRSGAGETNPRALEERWILAGPRRDADRGRNGLGANSSSRPRWPGRCITSPSTTSVTGTPRPIKPRLVRGLRESAWRPRSPRSSGCSPFFIRSCRT